MKHDMVGTPVTEAEVAADLGFADVFEMRRWDTEMGQKVAELERQLRIAESDRDNFRWHGKRMQVVLERLAESGLVTDPDLKLAIGVVLNKEVDWQQRLKGWFDEPLQDRRSSRQESPDLDTIRVR